MQVDNGRLNFSASIDNSQAQRDAQQLVNILKDIGAKAQKYGVDIEKYIGNGIKSASDATKAFKGVADELSAKIKTQQSVVQQLAQQYKDAKSAIDGNVMVSERQKQAVASLGKELQVERAELATMKLLLAQVNEQQVQNNNSTESMRARLRTLRETITELTMQWRAMTDAQRESSAGQAIKAQLDSAKKEASNLKDVMADVQREIKAGANDTAKFSALSEGMNLAVSSATALAGAFELLGMSSKDAEKVQAQIQSGLAISNGLMQAQNILQKESNLMVQIGNLQKWASAKAEMAKASAEKAGALATARATIAQKAFNLVAKANPYVLLATAIISVIGAIALFTKSTKEMSAEEERAKKHAEELRDAMKGQLENAYASKVEYDNMITRIKNFNGNKKEEKRLLDEVNNKYSDSFGYMKSLSQAYDVLVANSKVYCKQLILQAQIQAYASHIADLESQKHQLLFNPDGSRRTFSKAGGEKQTSWFGKVINPVASQLPSELDVAQASFESIDKQINSTKKSMEGLVVEANKLGQTFQNTGLSAPKGGGKSGGSNKKSGKESLTESEKFLEAWKSRVADYEVIANLREKQAEELIAIERDEAEKRRKQLALNQAKEREELRKQEQQMIADNRERALKANKNADVLSIGLTFDQQTEINKLREAMNNRHKFEREEIEREEKESAQIALDAFNKEYGDYAEKRKAIISETNRAIQDAKNEGEKRMAREKGKDELMALDTEWAQKNSKVLISLFKRTGRETSSQLRKIKKECADFLAWIQTGEWSEKMGALYGISAEQYESLKRNKEWQKQVTDGLKDVGEQADEAETQVNKLVKSFHNLFNGEFNVNNLKDFVSDLQNMANATNMLGDALVKVGEQSGNKSLEAIGKGIQTATSEIMSVGMMAVTGGMLGGGVGAIVGAGVGALASITKTIFSFGGYDWDSYNDMMTRYKALNDTWDVLIDKKKKYIEESYGREAEQVRKDAEQLVRAQTESARNMAREWLSAGSSWKSHSQGYNLNRQMSDEALKQAQQAFGRNWDTAILELSSEELKKLFENSNMAQFWAELKAYGGDYYEMIMQIIDESDALADLTDTLNERLTFKSFDELADNFADMLADMDADAKDFSEDMEKSFQNAILRTFVYQKYQSRLKNFYERWADAMNGDLNAGELDTLRNEYMGIVNDAINERNAIADALGFKSAGTDQNATAGGFQAMGQDTANELNGRFTAIQMDVSQVRQMMDEMRNISLNNMGYLEDIAKNTFQLYEITDRLAKIENYTSRL